MIWKKKNSYTIKLSTHWNCLWKSFALKNNSGHLSHGLGGRERGGANGSKTFFILGSHKTLCVIVFVEMMGKIEFKVFNLLLELSFWIGLRIESSHL